MKPEVLLNADERNTVIASLFGYKLIKYDPQGRLPLAGGGTTDLYVNLRNAREDPKAMDFLSNVYAVMIKPFEPSRILEVPLAVTCFTQGICSQLGVPLVTMRTEMKRDRVAGGIIGHIYPGDSVALVDDVITDGASKIPALALCKGCVSRMMLFVLVDRDQGWQKVLGDAAFGSVEVYAGMNLDHIREYLAAHPEALAS